MANKAAVLRARATACPPRVRRPVAARIRSAHALLAPFAPGARLTFLAVFALLAWWQATTPDGPYAVAIAGWVLAGANAWVVERWLAVDVRRRQARHDRSGLPSVRGWRLAARIENLDPELLLATALLIYLLDHAQLATYPVRGQRRSRTTYERSLRTLAREWGRTCGVSGRRADHLLATDLCDRFGVVRRVPVGNAEAFRLVDESVEAAVAHLERAAGVPLVAWDLGRDPRWDTAGGAPGGPVEAARAREQPGEGGSPDSTAASCE